MRMQPPVCAVSRHKLRILALLDNAAFVEHADAVGPWIVKSLCAMTSVVRPRECPASADRMVRSV